MKPSSFKRQRVPSGTPPKPAPRPAKKDLKKEPQEEKKEEKGEDKTEGKPAVKKEDKPKEEKEEKPEEKKEEKPKEKKEEKPDEKTEEKPEVKKEDKHEEINAVKEEEPDGKKEEQTLTEQKKEEAVEDKNKNLENVSVEEVKKKAEETKKEDTEAKEGKPSTELKERNGNEAENVDGKVENGETHNIKKKDDNETAVAKDDLWVRRDTGKEALRPGGRSMSLKIQRSTSGTEKGPAGSVRSATLPKPWSPVQAPSSMLSRKLSWEMPKAGGEDALRKKERSGSTSGEPIPEDSEDQSP